jgi:hypothetical protein
MNKYVMVCLELERVREKLRRVDRAEGGRT